MRSKISAHDQAKLGAEAGGVLLLWVGCLGILIFVPLGVFFLTHGRLPAGAFLTAGGVLLFLIVAVRHIRIVRIRHRAEDFFPDR